MPTVVLIGALEERGRAYEFVRTRLVGLGVDSILVDAGLRGIPAAAAEITREDVARAAGVNPIALRHDDDPNVVLATMARGAAEVATRLHAEGLLDAVCGIGGATSTLLLQGALEVLPAGVPHLILTTNGSPRCHQPSGNGISLAIQNDDPRGIDGIPEAMLTTAAGAVAGLAMAAVRFPNPARAVSLATIRAMGTTAGGTQLDRDRLRRSGYEVLYAR